MVSINAYAVPSAKVTYRVITEDGSPIEGVKVRAGFRGYSTNPAVDEGLTDEEGLFTASGDTQYEVTASIRKKGYYHSGYTYGGGDFTGISGIKGFRRWEPWNPTITVMLKKIKNPVALYMRNLGQRSRLGDIENTMPELEVGYDLIASDWVVPHGSGTHSDFIFKLEKNHITNTNFRDVLTIMFSNPGDGIQPYYVEKDNSSTFKVPYHAPNSGYDNELIQVYEHRPNKIFVSNFRKDQNYFFRIRSELDKEGNVISALYGKVEGNIMFAASNKIKAAWLKFKYFVNPEPNDTNLEFDETKNLFGNKFKRKN